MLHFITISRSPLPKLRGSLFNETLYCLCALYLSFPSCPVWRCAGYLTKALDLLEVFDEVRRLRGILHSILQGWQNIKKMTPLEFCSFASFDLMRSSSTIFYECMFEWAATPNLILHCHDNWNIRVVKVNRMSAVFGSFKKCIPGLSCPFTCWGDFCPWSHVSPPLLRGLLFFFLKQDIMAFVNQPDKPK